MDDKVFNQILHELSSENGFTATRVLDGVYELKKGSKKIYIKGKDFGLNTALAASFSRNKAYTFEILRRNRVNSVPHYELYQPVFFSHFGDQVKRNRLRVNAIIKKESLPLVLKPAEGSKARDVYLVHNKRQLNKLMDKLFIYERNLVLSPFREILHEYRVVILNNKVELIFDKVKKERVRHGKMVFGAKPKILNSDEKPYKKLETIAKKSAKALGLDFCSVDIIETENNGLEVLEINSSVCLGKFGNQSQEHYDIAKSIYKKVFKKTCKK